MKRFGTLVRALQRQALARGGAPALRQRLSSGADRVLDWRGYESLVSQVGKGLLELGLPPGRPVALLTRPRPEANAAALGAIGAGGVAAFLYEAWPASELRASLARLDPSVVVVEGARELDKLRELAGALPSLRLVVALEPVVAEEKHVRTLDEVVALGSQLADRLWHQSLDRLDPEAPAMLCLGGGMAGEPHAASLSHRALLWTAQRFAEKAEVRPGDALLGRISPSHALGQFLQLWLPLASGAQVVFAQPEQGHFEQLRRERPTIVGVLPEALERLRRGVERRLAREPQAKRKVFDWARRAMLERRRLNESGEPAAGMGRGLLGEMLVLEPLRRELGLERVRMLLVSGAPASQSAIASLASLGVPVCEGYALAEAGGPVALSGASSPAGSQGELLEGIEACVEADGELWMRGPGLCHSYFGDGQASGWLMDGEGWLRTGDLGAIDGAGALRIAGPRTEMLFSRGGERLPPGRLEARLREIPLVGQALVFGAAPRKLAALVALDRAAAIRFARQRGLPEDPEMLASHPALQAALQREIESFNHRAEHAERIDRFALLPQEPQAELGERTSSGAVRRPILAARHRDRIDELLR